MFADYIVMDEVRSQRCAAETARGFLAIWIPLSEEKQSKTIAQLLPLRVGKRAKNEYMIRYQHELNHTVSAITNHVRGALVVVLQEQENDRRKGNSVALCTLDGRKVICNTEIEPTNLARVRYAHVPDELEPQQEYLLYVGLSRR
jgi:hypothetical protein